MTCTRCQCTATSCPHDCCGPAYRTRLATIQVGISATPTRSRRRYYDADAIDTALGGTAQDRRERMQDDTAGIGYTVTDTDGSVWHRDRKTGEVAKLDQHEIDISLGDDLPLE